MFRMTDTHSTKQIQPSPTPIVQSKFKLERVSFCSTLKVEGLRRRYQYESSPTDSVKYRPINPTTQFMGLVSLGKSGLDSIDPTKR